MEKKKRLVSELKMHLKMDHQIVCKDEDDYYGVPQIHTGLWRLEDDKEVGAKARIEIQRLDAKYPKKKALQEQFRELADKEKKARQR